MAHPVPDAPLPAQLDPYLFRDGRDLACRHTDRMSAAEGPDRAPLAPCLLITALCPPPMPLPSSSVNQRLPSLLAAIPHGELAVATMVRLWLAGEPGGPPMVV
jgi:hypothetical protein